MLNANNGNYDNLIQNLSSLVGTTDKYVSELALQTISVVDKWTLGSAIAASVISFISIIVTLVVNKKVRESNEKIAADALNAENKRAEDAIDANLTANARIEWIQNVRQATAELISASYKCISSNPKEQQENWDSFLEKKALFVLYFGPDDNGVQEDLAKDLFDKNTNKGKNDKLVEYIKILHKNLEDYHFNNNQLKFYKDLLQECDECEHKIEPENNLLQCDNCEDRSSQLECKTCECYDIQKDYICESRYGYEITEEDCTKNKEKFTKNINKYNKLQNAVFVNLENFSEIMRIYAKIEWKRAKTGK